MAKTNKAIQTKTIDASSAEYQKTLLNDPAKIMVDIIKQQRTLYSKNIGDWIAARQAAQNVDFPQRSRLYDIYDDLILDEFIHGQVYNHRILPVKNRNFKIVDKEGVKNEDKTKLLKRRWFDGFIKHALESKFFGYSVAYLNEFEQIAGVNEVLTCDLIPRRHILQENGFILNWENDFIGKDYTQEPLNKYCIAIGDKLDLGLLNKAVPLWVLKKHAWQNWDEFAEIFGIPIRIVKTASQDPRVRSEIEGWVRDMGTAAYGVFPDGTDIEIKENNKTDAYKVFYELLKTANEGLAILFSGQTMTSMDGSSRSQAEVHQDVATEIRKDDEKFIAYEINYLMQILGKYHGYPFAEGDVFEWDVPEDVEGLISVFKAINGFGFQLDPEEVSTRLGVKILGLKQAAAPAVDPDAKPPKKEDELIEDDETENLTVAQILKLHADIAKTYSHI